MTLSRGRSAASSGPITAGKRSRMPASVATVIMRRMARPRRQILRPAATPASASVRRRAILLAKVVATTICFCAMTKSRIGLARIASERPGWGEKILVESQVRTLIPCPSWAISCHRIGSKASPTTGVPSSLKSPVCTMRPAGVSMISAELSGIEWLTGTNCTRNGPTSTTAGRGAWICSWSVGWPASSSFSRASAPVKRRQCTGFCSLGHNRPSAPT